MAKNFVKIYRFMTFDLNLKGVELLTYSLIFQICEEQKVFKESTQFIADYFGVSIRQVATALKNLTQKNFVIKKVTNFGIIKNCDYTLNTNFLPKSIRVLLS